ncbi:MAG: hypothetical protein ABI430_02890 [Candidatus Taylorbacteria bacterium]
MKQTGFNPVLTWVNNVTPLPGNWQSRCKNVADTVQIKVSDRQMGLLRRVDSEDYSRIAKKAELDLRSQGVTPMESERAIYALKQYYAVAVINPQNMHAIGYMVDPYWHAHILHTERYEQFCREAIGYFMHHRPLDHDEEQKVAAICELYDYTLDILNVIFNGHVDQAFWEKDPPTNRVMCSHSESPLLAIPGEEQFEPNLRLLAMRHLTFA